MIEVGKVVNVHGLMGELKIVPWTDSPENFYDFSVLYIEKAKEKRPYKIKSMRLHKGCVLVKLEGIDDRTAAERLKNSTVYAKREEFVLEEGRHFIADLIGLNVKTENESLGTLEDVFQTGANDVYSVRRKNGKMLYIPAIDDVIDEINIEGGYILITPIEGLLED